MNCAPRLLNNHPTALLPDTLFADFQLDKILSPQAIAVLKHPCGQRERHRRNELFALLDEDANFARVENALSTLSHTEHALDLL